jgi:hypothetical protein
MRTRQYQILAGIVVLALLAIGVAAVFTRANSVRADAGGIPHLQHIFYHYSDSYVGQPWLTWLWLWISGTGCKMPT